MIKDFEKAKEQISAANSIEIISHINPDGDNIGSLIGLGEGLKKIGKKVRLLKSDEVPKYLAFLPKTEEIRELEKSAYPKRKTASGFCGRRSKKL